MRDGGGCGIKRVDGTDTSLPGAVVVPVIDASDIIELLFKFKLLIELLE